MSKVEMKVGEWYANRRGEIVFCGMELPSTVERRDRFVCYRASGTIETHTAEGSYYFDGSTSKQDIARHLPGCTGFDWQEPKIPEGWRRLADDEVLTREDMYVTARDGSLATVFSYDGRYVKDVQANWATKSTFPYAIIRKIEEPKPEPKFKVGDVVYATKPKDVSQHPTWDSAMDKTAGVPLKVVRVDPSDGIHICELDKDTNWYYHEDWLSKEPPAAQYRPFANDEEYAPHFDRAILRSSSAAPEVKGQYRLAAFDDYQVWTSDNCVYTYEQMFKDGRKFADTNEPFGVKL
jgi:hypothetical protein